jgi:hypothetical protein
MKLIRKNIIKTNQLIERVGKNLYLDSGDFILFYFMQLLEYTGKMVADLLFKLILQLDLIGVPSRSTPVFFTRDYFILLPYRPLGYQLSLVYLSPASVDC